MAKKIQFTLEFDEDVDTYIKNTHPQVLDFRILSQSLDARKANLGRRPKYHYTVEAIAEGEKFEAFTETFPKLGPLKSTPVIIGAGPAGLFCALRLAEFGIPSIIIERGAPAHKRMLHIARFWRYGQFDSENNVCYGEGGAGLFSDGKLITRVKSPFVKYVMQRFVDFGAPPETAYISNPHLGSNKIRGLISGIVKHLESKGCQFHYQARVTKILCDDASSSKAPGEKSTICGVELSSGEKIYSDNIVLATGHSASEMYEHLKSLEVDMSLKDFSVGVRIEHPRRQLDSLQYGSFNGHAALGAARYRLSHYDQQTQKGTYSFCMCPGGYVLSSGTDSSGIVVNGMSNFARNSPWSNAALVVTIKAGEDFDSKNILNGLYFQKEIEQKAFRYSQELASGREVPAQKLMSFFEGQSQVKTEFRSPPKTSCPSGVFQLSLDHLFPEFVLKHLRAGLGYFDQNIKGFLSKDALLMAPETRTSSPVTVNRDHHTCESLSHKGLYPCGEGAGYAGGITSAAADGCKVAMAIIFKEKSISI